MIDNVSKLNEFLHDESNYIKFKKNEMKNIILKFNIYYISEKISPDNDEISKITQNIKNSEIILIDHKSNYLIICFEKTLIILEHTSFSFLQKFIFIYSSSYIFFLSDSKDIIKDKIAYKNIEIEVNSNFLEEISNFSKDIYLFTKRKDIKGIWSMIVSSMAGYLIKKSYFKSDPNRIENFIDNIEEYSNPEIIDENDIIELRNIGTGSVFKCNLIYLIKKEELGVIKIPYGNDIENVKLIEREKNNYLTIKHPFLPKFYGTIKNKNFIVIEFIRGQTLQDIDLNILEYKDRITIMVQIIFIILFFHSKNLIYRDLKPNNIMINEYKAAILIDLDRLIGIDCHDQTLNFQSDYFDPEICQTGKFSYKSDIYSLGKVIDFLFNLKSFDSNSMKDIDFDIEYPIICKISQICTDKTEKRPLIWHLKPFFVLFHTQIRINLTNNFIYDHFTYFTIINNIAKDIFDPNKQYQYLLGYIYCYGIYVKQDIDKSIHYLSLAAYNNDSDAQNTLGQFYFKGILIPFDISKAIHYLSQAANQNHPEAQTFLGEAYLKGIYVPTDINKAIYYFSLAAKQNYSQGQFKLGLIYTNGINVARDINKGIYYYLLAAKQNHIEAQYNLGIIYYNGQYVMRDIDKAIYYFSLAAKQDLSLAQEILGSIYYEGKYIQRDINKSIYYFSLAANQNDSRSQYVLGIIFLEGKYVPINITKAIHYLELAANQNDIHALFILGLTYYEGIRVPRNMNKAIHYFTLAAKLNEPESQFKLGLIYSESQFVPRDMNKAIYYYLLASNNNIPEANYNLGLIYYDGKTIPRDIKKAIYYFSLASNQKYTSAYFKLGVIYSDGKYVPIDISQAIYYFTLASDQNLRDAQYNLATLYYEGKYVSRDINKAIYYYTLAADQSFKFAQFILGVIYYEGKYIHPDINKSIHYLELSANQYYSYAQFYLGFIYYEGKHIARNINKAIHYLSLAAKTLPNAQFSLGSFYYTGELFPKNVQKGISFIIQASQNGYRLANFAHGFLYHEGKYIKRNAEKAIHYYKEASSFNINFAKNNLGVIYKYGFEHIKKNIYNAIEYFEEAINQENDYVSMYNLAHIYIYDETIEHNFDKSIELLIKSSDYFIPSIILLCFALIRKFGFDLKIIKKEVVKRTGEISELPLKVYETIECNNLTEKYVFESKYESFKTKDYLYAIGFKIIQSSMLDNQKLRNISKYPNTKNISSLFYEGFGDINKFGN